MIFIFWFVAEIFEPYGLAPFGHLVIAISLIGMIVVPMFKLAKFFLYPGRMREVKRGRFYFSLVCVAGLIALICYFPLPHYVWGTFVVRPESQQQVMLNERGRLVQVLTPESATVEPGQMIAILENEELDLEKVELEVRRARLEQDLSAYRTRSSVESSASARIAELSSSLGAVNHQIALLDRQLQEMTLRADRKGQLFAPLNRKQAQAVSGDLTQWSGTPLSPENVGAWFDANTMFGVIGDPNRMEAVIVISQSDVQLLQPGQEVLARCRQFTRVFLHSEIESVSQDELLQVPPELSQTNGGPIAVSPAMDAERPVLKSYTAVAAFDAEEMRRKKIGLLPGMRGDVRILVGTSPLGSRLKRYLNSVIKFR